MEVSTYWSETIPSTFAEFIAKGNKVNKIDLIELLPVGVLWPVRQQLKSQNPQFLDLLVEICGNRATQIAEIVAGWGDDFILAARNLTIQAEKDAKLKVALSALNEYFNSTHIFIEQFIKYHIPNDSQNNFNIDDIKALIVNVGGVTTIESLKIELNLPTQEHPNPWLTGRRRYITGMGVAILLVSSILIIYRFVIPPQPPVLPMSGNINIAVAEFLERSPSGELSKSTDAYDAANSIYKSLVPVLSQLQDEINESGHYSFDFETRSPSLIGPINNGSVEEVAKRHNADIVIYGFLEKDVGRTIIYPELYLREDRLVNAAELAGVYKLGGFDISNPSMFASEIMETEITSRTQTIAQLAIGLNLFINEEYQNANHYFINALGIKEDNNIDGYELKGDDIGKEIAYLFLGNIDGKQGKYNEAISYYESANSIHKKIYGNEYARAKLGLAEIMYAQTNGGCEKEKIDVNGVLAAKDAYLGVLDISDQPISAFIKTKVSYKVGRVYACLTQALAGDYNIAAEENLNEVIDEYESDKSEKIVQYYASEAYGIKGFLALPLEDDPNPQDAYSRAKSYFIDALDLMYLKERKAFFNTMLGFICGRLGELDQAEKYYLDAAELDPSHREEYYQQIALLKEPTPTPQNSGKLP